MKSILQENFKDFKLLDINLESDFCSFLKKVINNNFELPAIFCFMFLEMRIISIIIFSPRCTWLNVLWPCKNAESMPLLLQPLSNGFLMSLFMDFWHWDTFYGQNKMLKRSKFINLTKWQCMMINYVYFVNKNTKP